MADKEEWPAISLTPEQKLGVVDAIGKDGAIFFTPEQLKNAMALLGPKAKVTELKAAIEKQHLKTSI